MAIYLGGNEYGTFLGREVVKVGIDYLLGEKVMLNIARPSLILVVGKRGSGKSFTLGVIAENIGLTKEKVRNQISLVILDTMNIFSTLKKPNYENLDLLAKWNLEPQKIEVNEYYPLFRKEDFSFEDVLEFFELDINDERAYYIYEYLQGKRSDLPESVALRMQELEKFFSNKSILDEIVKPGIHIIKLGQLPWYSKRAIANIILRKIFETRMQAREKEIEMETSGIFSRDVPLFWVLIDEAHEFLAKDVNSPVKNTLVQIIREGRGPGVSLVLATQQPNKLEDDALTQANIVIAHKLTNKVDIETVNSIMRNFVDVDLEILFAENLPNKPGAALVLDDKSERVYPIMVRPRITYHGGRDAMVYL